MDSPGKAAIVYDDSLTKTKEIVEKVKALQRYQAEVDLKDQKEHKEHDVDRQRIKTIEAEYLQMKQGIDAEAKGHILTQEKIDKEELYHSKTKESLRTADEDVTRMRLQMDAMKVEMEAQRKAFVINVNWAARCTELKAKFDSSMNEYDQLFEAHVKGKTEMEACLRAQEEFKEKCQTGSDSRAATQHEIDRQLDDMRARSEVGQEVRKKLDELDEFRARAAHEEAQKKLGSSKALSVLQRSLAKGEDGIKVSAFGGWSTVAREEKKKRLTKDKAMKRCLKNIAGGGMALCNEVYKEWSKEMERVKAAALRAATKRLEEASHSTGAGSMTGRSRAIAQLEKQFKGEDLCLTQSCFHGWALGQIARKKREQNHKKASRLIANSGKAILAEIVGLWNDLTEQRRRKNRSKAANMQAAGRMIANSAVALQANIFTSWWGMIEDIRRKRKKNEEGTAKAMRMMANSDQALTNLCFDSWMKLHFQTKQKDAGNKKALRMIGDSAQALIIGVFEAWAKMFGAKKAKEANTAKAVRMINSSSEALSASVYQAWSSYISKNRDKNKKIRVLEKSFGAQDMGLKMVVHTSWQGFAKIEGRQKRAKNLSMKTAISSITGNQELLLCHLLLAWGRYASFDRMGKVEDQTRVKESEFEQAVEKARGAFEGDLVDAQKRVDEKIAELEAGKRERDEAKASIKPTEGRLEETSWNIEDYDRKVASLEQELLQSRRKAEDIGKELSKVGMFLANAPQRRVASNRSRPNSASDKKLPLLGGSNSRPRSGASGSKTARGVAGERGGSGRSDGRPPRSPHPQDSTERRYLLDGAGPYTFVEIQEGFGDNALAQWSAGAPELSAAAQDTSYGSY